MSSASEKRLLDKKNAEIEQLLLKNAKLNAKNVKLESNNILLKLDNSMKEAEREMDENKKFMAARKVKNDLKKEKESTRLLKSENEELKALVLEGQTALDDTSEKLRLASDEVQRLQWYKDRVAVLERQGPSLPLQKSPPAVIPNCKICLLPYNETPEKTPRMLKCGHTVCEECIVTIRDMHIQTNVNSAERNIVLCPFDRTETELKEGSARSLPKNFTVMEMIESGLEAMKL